MSDIAGSLEHPSSPFCCVEELPLRAINAQSTQRVGRLSVIGRMWRGISRVLIGVCRI